MKVIEEIIVKPSKQNQSLSYKDSRMPSSRPRTDLGRNQNLTPIIGHRAILEYIIYIWSISSINNIHLISKHRGGVAPSGRRPVSIRLYPWTINISILLALKWLFRWRLFPAEFRPDFNFWAFIWRLRQMRFFSEKLSEVKFDQLIRGWVFWAIAPTENVDL